MPTKKQLPDRWATEFANPGLRAKDDPAYVEPKISNMPTTPLLSSAEQFLANHGFFGYSKYVFIDNKRISLAWLLQEFASQFQQDNDRLKEEIEHLKSVMTESAKEDLQVMFGSVELEHRCEQLQSEVETLKARIQKEADLVVKAAQYGFWYALNSQHSGDVPEGNVLQWFQTTIHRSE